VACPTCDHTMQRIGNADHDQNGIYWCPRCGSIQELKGILVATVVDQAVPNLVERCRKYEAELDTPMGRTRANWYRLGIRESINTPENRPSLEE